MRRLSNLPLPLVFCALWLQLASGCFSEPVDSGSGTEGSCELGQPTCECLESTCVQGYECNDANRCIGENCTPGTEGCSCAQGDCLPALQCLGGICLDPGTTSSTTPTSVTDTVTTTTVTDDSTTSPQTDSTTTEVTDSTTEVQPTTSVADSSSTTGTPVSCADEVLCTTCFNCTHEAECAPEFNACTGACLVAAQCMASCAIDGLCFDDCCGGLSPANQQAALDLQDCREGTCILGPCRSFSDPTCSG